MIFLSAHRNGDLENGAGVPVAGADGSLVQVDDLPGQGKADAGFSAFSHVEAVKDVGKIFLGDAVPVVLYPYRRIPNLHYNVRQESISTVFRIHRN